MTGAATGGYMLYRDMTGVGASGQGAPIAQVLNTEKRVKRKLASSYVWNNVQKEQALFRRESIQTGAESAAMIRLSDGATVEVRENSLVVIDETKSLMNNFIHGSLILHQESGDSLMTVGNDGKVQVRELPVKLISPSLSEIFYTTKGRRQSIRFEWKLRDDSTLDKNALTTVQLARDTTFKTKQTLTGSSSELTPGRYYWRIVQTKEGQQEEVISTVAQFSVIEATPLILTAPSDGERVDFYGMDATIEFRWVEQRGASFLENISHELEVSEDRKFETITATKRIAASSQISRIKGLTNGSFYWRIRSKWGPVNVTTPTQSFSTVRAARMPIQLLTPRENATLPVAPLRLSWRSDFRGPDSRYSVEVESTTPNLNFSTVQSTQAGGINLSSLSAGSYRWRVKTLLKDEITGESEWSGFSIAPGGSLTLKAPYVNQRIWYWKDPARFTFEWEPDALVTSEGSTYAYQVELSNEVDFRNSVAKKRSSTTSLSSAEIALKPGNYYWRLQVIGEKGEALKTSTPLAFTYGVHPLLAAPNSATPASETKLNPLQMDTDPQLSWNPVKEAVSYEVVVTRQVKDVKKLWLRQVTTETSVPLRDAPEGVYYWSVRALDQLDRLGEPLSDHKLILDAGETLAPPKTLTREVQ